MTFSKYSDIDAVIKKANTLLLFIEERYINSLHVQEINQELLVEIKDYLGNLRSSLDYLGSKMKLDYFPMGNSEKDFMNKVNGLDQIIINSIMEVQPYKDSMIKNFNILNNKNKHVTLIPQKRKETKQTSVSNGLGNVSWGEGVVFGGGVSVMGVLIDHTTQLPVPNNIVKTEIVVWIDFVFDNSNAQELDGNISALPFLKDIFSKITNLIINVEKHLV